MGERHSATLATPLASTRFGQQTAPHRCSTSRFFSLSHMAGGLEWELSSSSETQTPCLSSTKKEGPTIIFLLWTPQTLNSGASLIPSPKAGLCVAHITRADRPAFSTSVQNSSFCWCHMDWEWWRTLTFERIASSPEKYSNPGHLDY